MAMSAHFPAKAQNKSAIPSLYVQEQLRSRLF